jgi:hypothetical protein
MTEMNAEERRIWRFKREYTDLVDGLNDRKGVWKMKPPTPLHVVSILVNHLKEGYDDLAWLHRPVAGDPCQANAEQSVMG